MQVLEAVLADLTKPTSVQRGGPGALSQVINKHIHTPLPSKVENQGMCRRCARV